MPKIMLVEDDNNLREIYEARLLAEGYEIVSAKDGEEALAMAVKEKPDLIISDVMMPKISGFDMLDILRSTPETKNAKVIMMTALSQAEDKSRADKLGADRYLVKSQVTLEDVAKVAREVLNGEDSTPPAAKLVASVDMPANNPPTPPPAAPAVTPVPVTPAPDPTPPVEPPAADPPIPPAPSPPAEPPTPPTPPEPPVTPAATTSEPPVAAPTIDPAQAQTAASEEKAVDDQINQFINNLPTQAPPAVTPTPNPTPPAEPPVPVTPPEPTAPTPPIENPSPQPEEPTPGPTVQAAADAANLAHTVNDIFDKKDTPSAPQAVDTTTSGTSSGGSMSIAGKKVIKPLNDITTQGPDLNKLLEKEQQASSVSPPPATSVVAPGGETVTPAAPNKAPDNHAPGNVIQPGGGPTGVDPNSIAL
ncbi:MAG TPA: response regulator [Verrucomicrobiae bacterium]|nr:response regulator [Verrucomicrobiae bacterium]